MKKAGSLSAGAQVTLTLKSNLGQNLELHPEAKRKPAQLLKNCPSVFLPPMPSRRLAAARFAASSSAVPAKHGLERWLAQRSQCPRLPSWRGTLPSRLLRALTQTTGWLYLRKTAHYRTPK